jgi:hypothetical protein
VNWQKAFEMLFLQLRRNHQAATLLLNVPLLAEYFREKLGWHVARAFSTPLVCLRDKIDGASLRDIHAIVVLHIEDLSFP